MTPTAGVRSSLVQHVYRVVFPGCVLLLNSFFQAINLKRQTGLQDRSHVAFTGLRFAGN